MTALSGTHTPVLHPLPSSIRFHAGSFRRARAKLLAALPPPSCPGRLASGPLSSPARHAAQDVNPNGLPDRCSKAMRSRHGMQPSPRAAAVFRAAGMAGPDGVQRRAHRWRPFMCRTLRSGGPFWITTATARVHNGAIEGSRATAATSPHRSTDAHRGVT